MTIRAEDVAGAQAIQFAAAHSHEAQVRLIAGPGSGKSLTIEERVRWLLDSGVDASEIAVVSFTNASVIDLKLRLHEYCRGIVRRESNTFPSRPCIPLRFDYCARPGSSKHIRLDPLSYPVGR